MNIVIFNVEYSNNFIFQNPILSLSHS